jgi:hypothetical protein
VGSTSLQPDTIPLAQSIVEVLYQSVLSRFAPYRAAYRKVDQDEFAQFMKQQTQIVQQMLLNSKEYSKLIEDTK